MNSKHKSPLSNNIKTIDVLSLVKQILWNLADPLRYTQRSQLTPTLLVNTGVLCPVVRKYAIPEYHMKWGTFWIPCHLGIHWHPHRWLRRFSCKTWGYPASLLGFDSFSGIEESKYLLFTFLCLMNLHEENNVYGTIPFMSNIRIYLLQ